MKTKKVTITYQATEPKEWVYKVQKYYGEAKVEELVAASTGSLLEWFFDDLDYKKSGNNEFMPHRIQPIHNLKREHWKVKGKMIDRVEIKCFPLYV